MTKTQLRENRNIKLPAILDEPPRVCCSLLTRLVNHSASFGNSDSISIVKPRAHARKATQRLEVRPANGRITKNEITAMMAMPLRTTG